MKVVVYLPLYNEKIGGVIALHKLLHILRTSSKIELAVGYPYFDTAIYDVERVLQGHTEELLKYQFTLQNLHHYRVHPEFDCSFIDIANRQNLEVLVSSQDIVVIYPEVIAGNPTGIKNVVRWLLHDPGRLTKKVHYGTGELYFPYSHLTAPIVIPKSKTSTKIITVQQTPFDMFYSDTISKTRSGSAYCIRKGKGRRLIHDLNDSICIDDLSQEEIAKIFKTVEIFYSYDTRTFYSELASLAGCKSVIIPNPEEDVRDKELLYGIAYGVDDLDRAEKTKHLLYKKLKNDEQQSYDNVKDMVEEIRNYFNLN
jgi:hypothetical protein